MKTLYQLASIVKSRQNIVEALVENENSILLSKFFKLLFVEEAIEESSIKNILFGSDFKPSEYSKLKAKLKDILLKCLSIDIIPWEEPDSRLNEFHKQYNNYLGNIYLFDSKQTVLGIKFIEKDIRRAIKYEFTDLTINLTRVLVAHFGSDQYNDYKFRKYIKILDIYSEIYKWELISLKYYVTIQNSMSESPSHTSNYYKKLASNYVNDLESVNVDSFNFNYNKYRLMLVYFEYIKDYESILINSIKILNMYDSKFITKTKRGNINLRIIWALIQGAKYEEAISMGLNTLKDIQKYTSSYYAIIYYTIKAYLYSGLFKEAFDFIHTSISDVDNKYLKGVYFEIISLSIGYSHLIVASGMVSESEIYAKQLPPFRISKFLNEIPNYSKDKRGINVSILLMHITFLLQRKDYGKIIDRVDALKFYAYRHLRRDDTFRSNCMIKMVVQMAKADFHPVRTERYTEDLFRQLQEVKLAGSGQNIETEIIPYEVLWEIMKKALK